MKLTLEIPGQVSLGQGYNHGVVTLKLDTESHTLSIGFEVERREYGYTGREYKEFGYRLVPVEEAA